MIQAKKAPKKISMFLLSRDNNLSLAVPGCHVFSQVFSPFEPLDLISTESFDDLIDVMEDDSHHSTHELLEEADQNAPGKAANYGQLVCERVCASICWWYSRPGPFTDVCPSIQDQGDTEECHPHPLLSSGPVIPEDCILLEELHDNSPRHTLNGASQSESHEVNCLPKRSDDLHDGSRSYCDEHDCRNDCPDRWFF